MASFFDEIAKNRIKSVLLMLIFGALFSVIVYFAVLLFGGGPFGFAFGIGMIVVYASLVYFTGDKVILAVSRAKEADRSQYRVLYDTVDGLATASQIPMPKVYIIEDPNPNAFATGRNMKMASVAVTTGLLSMMNRSELEGVLSHEISHISDNDIQFMMIAIVFAGVIGLISAFIRNMFFYGFGGSRNRGSGYLILIALVVGLLAPLFALLIRLAISRRREYMADANGARITRNPGSLASALGKIQKYAANPGSQPVQHASEMTESLYFANPFKAQSLMSLFSTHPPIEERIARLEKMY